MSSQFLTYDENIAQIIQIFRFTLQSCIAVVKSHQNSFIIAAFNANSIPYDLIKFVFLILQELLLLEKLSTIAATQTYAELQDTIAELVLQEKNFANGAVQLYTELQEKNCDLVKQLQNAEERVQQLQDSVQRFLLLFGYYILDIT